MPPAARIGDLHVCPMVDGVKPHVGGPISVGCPTVLIGGMPAARVGDMAVCVGPPDMIAKGSTGVFIGGMPAARLGDSTVHGGVITVGFPTVMIGELGGGPSSPKTPEQSSLFELVAAFGEGVWDSIPIINTIGLMAAQYGLVLLGLNPAFAVAAFAVWGVYKLYDGLKEAGGGDASKGAEKAWDAFVNGSDKDKAYVAGFLAGSLASKRGTAKLSKSFKGLGRKARKLGKFKNIKNSKNSKALEKINSKTHGGTKAGKAAKAVDTINDKADALLIPANAGEKLHKKNEEAGTGGKSKPSQASDQGPSGEKPVQNGNDQPDVMTISTDGESAQNYDIGNENQISVPSPNKGAP